MAASAKLFLSFFLFLLLPERLLGQLPDYNVQMLGEGSGISMSNVHKLVKDKKGFLWILSRRVVQRFDGRNTVRFDAEGEDWLDIAVDLNGQIWLSSHNELRTYVDDREGFRAVPIAGGRKPKFNLLDITPDNQVWALSGSGLYRYDRRRRVFQPHPIPGLGGMVFYRRIFRRAGEEFFIGDTHALFAYNYRTGRVRKTDFHAVRAIAPFSEDILWATNADLEMFELDFRSETASKIAPARFTPAATYLTINSVMPLGGARALVTTSKGCYLYERGNGRFKRAVFYYQGRELSNNEIITGYRDDDGTIWLVSKQGILFFNPDRHTITWLRNFRNLLNEENNDIRAITGDGAGRIWMATTEGLSCLDPSTGRFDTFMPSVAGDPDFRFPTIHALNFDGERLILGPGSGGPLLMDPRTGSFEKPRYPPGKEGNALRGQVEHDYIYGIQTVGGGNQLILADASCYLLDRNTHLLTELRFAGSDYILQTARTDRTGNIWVGTFKGLLYLDGHFRTIYADSTFYPGKLVTSILPRNDSTVWAGSVGLFEVTRTRTGLRKKRIIPELKTSQITNLYADRHGRVWIAADEGLYRFSEKDRKLEWFDVWDNVQNKQLNPGSIYEDARGRVYWGGHNGLNYFDPLKISLSQQKLHVYIMSVTVNHEDTLFKPRQFDAAFMATPGGLRLDWNENSVEIHFTAAYYQNPQKVHYRYQLDGLHTGWVRNGHNNVVRFSSLAPGSYTFKAAASLDGISWQESGEKFTFVITPPLWERPWFVTVSLALVTGLIYYLHRKRIEAIKQRQARIYALQDKANKLEKEKTLVMFESLKQQLNPHFLFNSLASLESLIWDDAGKASRFLEGLSSTYRYILKNQNNELVPLCEELEFAAEYVRIQQTRFREGLDVQFSVDASCENMLIAPVTIRNLVENAIKHNVMSQDLPMQVRIYPENGYIVVRNNLQKKRFVETSNRQGLKNLYSLYSYLTPLPVQRLEADGFFTVKVPLIAGNGKACHIETDISHESNHH
ncbi:histidine kinase [Dyadobacter sp. 676]|uniref:Histidine kinase n=1 Tax=Dyadobacter sp. 676 TaxID=3088362 RepID=A0AAU8FJB0_9BACT